MITFRPIGIFINVPDPDPTTNIPAYTVRIRLLNGSDAPHSSAVAPTQPFPSTHPEIYDYTYVNSDWNHLLANQSNQYQFEIVGINSTGVTNMERMFDLSDGLCGNIPLFDTSAVTNVENMFYQCHNITGGIYALYNQMSTQTNPPSSHSGCFQECADYNVTGQAELAQIPSDWGGTQSSGPSWNYRVIFAASTPTINVNTICLDRNQEGTGNCYSDSSCSMYLSDLSQWDSSTLDTTLYYSFTQGPWYIFEVYVKDVTIQQPLYNTYGTIIAGSSDYEWTMVRVFDSDECELGSAGTPSSPGDWVNITY